MITYIDTSILLKLILEETGSDRAAMIWRSADTVAAASIGYVEARAALGAAHRNRRLSRLQLGRAKQSLDLLWSQLSVVEVTIELVAMAGEYADRLALRGYDAVHLAAASTIGADVFSSADRRLCDVAGRIGFHVADPTDIGQ